MKTTVPNLRALAVGRQLDPDAAEACIVERLDSVWVIVDTSHPAFPRGHRASSSYSPSGEASEPPPSGPGTELKGLLKTIGITANPGCSCNAKAAQMDIWGPDECERRLEEIVDWLAQEAKKRNLPFFRMGAQQLVRLAIRRARKNAAP